MKIKLKTLRQIETLAQFTDVDLPQLQIVLKFRRRFRRYSFPKSINDIAFENFVMAAKHTEIKQATAFMKAVTGYDISRIPVRYTLGAYQMYIKQYAEIMELFRKQEELISKAAKVKYDMQEFGLTNIVSFLAAGSYTEYASLMLKPVSFIFVEYRRKIKNIENINYQNPTPNA